MEAEMRMCPARTCLGSEASPAALVSRRAAAACWRGSQVPMRSTAAAAGALREEPPVWWRVSEDEVQEVRAAMRQNS
ncbi:hypothetical protein [Streptomyces yanii]|uniref:hypothetical protein n=1 Tax=Streptomyces yanii TaxID=78510 RepID=UPI0031E9A08A